MTAPYLFKIWSGFDGFTPRVIPKRTEGNGLLRLGWKLYTDELEHNDEVWVYFFGPGVIPGVYIIGRVAKVDAGAGMVWIRPKSSDTSEPLFPTIKNARIGEIVKSRGRQVFLYPEEWELPPECSIDQNGSSCRARECAECPTWQSVRRINEADFDLPRRLYGLIRKDRFIPAYWIEPSRCYLSGKLRQPTLAVSRYFRDFKLGDETKAFPFALGLFESLLSARDEAFDEVIPIPLSPDKVAAGELNRTRCLADELSRLICAKVANRLSLSAPISKRRPPWNELSASAFEKQYTDRLEVRTSHPPGRVLLVDDVATRGTTLAATLKTLQRQLPTTQVVIGVAGLMILKEVVRSDQALVRPT